MWMMAACFENLSPTDVSSRITTTFAMTNEPTRALLAAT
jgi:hypothetical protein